MYSLYISNKFDGQILVSFKPGTEEKWFCDESHVYSLYISNKFDGQILVSFKPGAEENDFAMNRMCTPCIFPINLMVKF